MTNPEVSLTDQARLFREHLEQVKNTTPLHPALKWYPWPTMAGFDILEEMLGVDRDAMLRMIGREPVLDIGCGDGDASFFLESLGLSVDAVDHAPTNYNALYGVRALIEALQSKVSLHPMDIDSDPDFPAAHYGLTFLLGVLYHLKNPYLVLEALARRSDFIYLSTRIAQCAPDGTSYRGQPVAYLVDDRELNQDTSNFWIFSEEALKRMLWRSGWELVHYVALGPVETSDPVRPERDARAYLVAKSRLSGRIDGIRLLEGWHQREDVVWRWTARQFAVEFEVPRDVASPALEFAFHLPEVVMAQHPSVTLSVRIGDQELPPMTLNTAGDVVYTTRVGPLKAGFVRVDFELDRNIGQTEADPRELGVLVNFHGRSPVRLT